MSRVVVKRLDLLHQLGNLHHQEVQFALPEKVTLEHLDDVEEA
jgi:hypothetical protein